MSILRRPRWMMYGEVYVWRTRKPGALLGLPLLGRHFAYVGQTRNPKARDWEHLKGGGRWGCVPKDWADLDPKKWVLFRMRHCPQWVLGAVEVFFIRVLLPVYNVQWNRGNLRRIRPEVARLQRQARDRLGVRWSPHFTPAHLLTSLGLTAMVVMVVWR